jgi:FdhD protein
MVMRLSEAAVRRPVSDVQVLAFDAGGVRTRPDQLVTEEPMEVRVAGPRQEPVPFAVAMRTPGNDFELAAGLCFTEGLIAGSDDLDSIAYCLGPEREQLFNVVTVQLRAPVPDGLRDRRYLSNSSCGICGKAALEEIEVRCAPVGAGPTLAASVIASLPEQLARHQGVFDQTGGLHAAARFEPDGTLREAREDVGRHNALDKLIGHALLDGKLPLANDILLVSGRLWLELVQKAAVAGISVLCAVSAPSSLAVAAAEQFGQTVVGFLRDGRFNVYAHPERVDVNA